MAHQSEELQQLRNDYMIHEMSKEQRDMLCLKMNQAKKENAKERNRKKQYRFMSVAAVMVMGFVIWLQGSSNITYAMEKVSAFIGRLFNVVTVETYEYEDDKSRISVDIPQLEIDETSDKELNESVLDNPEKVEDAKITEEVSTVSKETIIEINEEILQIVDGIKKDFEAYLTEGKGYREVIVDSEVLASTEEYFSMKLMTYESAADGAERNYFYTIDLSTAKRLELKDLFVDDTDYITVISEEIKNQMKAQMQKKESVIYWIEEEITDMNFVSITEETSFYLDQQGQLVIAFDEGEVAPMSMGSVEFMIAPEILEAIRK